MDPGDHGGILAARALGSCGVRTIFALPGGHILPLFDGARREGLTLVGTRHEENAVFMAEGWALATATPGVAAVTAGPGLANAFAGLAEANAAGAPVVVIAGRTGLAQRGRGAVQDLDQLGAAAVASKWRDECLETGRIPERVFEAVHRARAGAPGVAYLEIPQDVFAAAAPADEHPWPMGHDAEPARSVPVAGDVERAVAVLAGAAQPAIVAGSGAFFSRAGPALGRFAERTGIPVTTTSAARGLLDDRHPRCLGSLVHGGIALASADASLVLGSRFNANLVYGGPPLFPPGQRIVQVDAVPEHLGGLRRPDVALAGDVAATLDALTDAWPAPPGRFDDWTERAMAGASASRTSWDAECERPADGLHPGWLAREVARFAREQDAATFVSDGGDSVVWGIAMSEARRPGTNLFIGSAMGTLGIGLPFALGAKAARPGEPVFVFTGDGAFGLSAIELDTAARHGLGVVVVVANNGGWGDVRHEQRMYFGPEADRGADLPGLRYDLLAQAAGGYGERVVERDEVRPALERALKASSEGVPAVVDAATDPEVLSDLMRNLGSLGVM
ncbi:MAG TPA: thiamine pyrophosphate-binding protein [Actinomycetota bacterium]|jgi:acetolactate synthase-1/2/3 large subunit